MGIFVKGSRYKFIEFSMRTVIFIRDYDNLIFTIWQSIMNITLPTTCKSEKPMVIQLAQVH